MVLVWILLFILYAISSLGLVCMEFILDIPHWIITVIHCVSVVIYGAVTICFINLYEDRKFYKRKWEEEKCRRD